MSVTAHATAKDRAGELARALDAAGDPVLRRERFDLQIPASAGAQDAWMIGHLLGPRPIPNRPVESINDAARFVRDGLAQLTGAPSRKILLADSVASATELVIRRLYTRRDPRMRLFAMSGVDPAIHDAQRRCASEFGLEPDKHVAWLHPTWASRHHDPAALLDFFRRYGHEYSIVVLDAADRYTGEARDTIALSAAARAAGCLVGWDLSGVIGVVPVNLPAWGADFAVWATDGYLNGGAGNAAGLYLADLPEERGEDSAAVPATWSAAAAGRLADALGICVSADLPAMYERAGRLGAYLHAQVTAQLESVPSAAVLSSGPGQPCLRTSVALAQPNAEQISAHMRTDGVLVDAHEPDLLVLSPAPLYCTFHDCWRAATALTRRVTQ